MNRYNSWVAKMLWLFNGRGGAGYAITLGQTVYYSCDESLVTPRWRAEEDFHKTQWTRDGKVKFIVRYLWQLVTKGYSNIDYEIEAKAAAAKVGGKC